MFDRREFEALALFEKQIVAGLTQPDFQESD
jgi:hypothetical protein